MGWWLLLVVRFWWFCCLYGWWCLIRFYNFILLLFGHSIIKSHAFKVIDHDLITHFLLSFFLLCSLIIFCVSNYCLCLWDLFIYEDVGTLFREHEVLLWFWFFLYLFMLWLSSIKFNINLISQYWLVFLHDRRLVINVSISICNHTTFSEILQRSAIGSFLHEQKLS